MKSTGTVSQYISDFSGEAKKKLVELRKIVTTAAPKAEEKISYGMVGYKYLGKPLVYFGGFKNHIGFYGASSTFFNAYAKELEGFKTSKGTVQFPLDKPLPVGLIKKLVKERIKQNEAKV